MAADAPLRLTFLGAVGTVTGSRYLVEAGGRRILVDCGLFQGYKSLRLRNWAPFPVAPESIDAVVLTHAHLDHSGYLPRLRREGFAGPVWCSAATRDLCGILLPDSGRLLEEEAGYANAKHSTRHDPADPLYTESDARRCLAAFRAVDFDAPFEPLPGMRVTLRPQGHILGAAAVALAHEGTSVTFSGDVGRPHDPIMPAPAALAACDYVVVESTYGDRRHPHSALAADLQAALSRAIARNGVVVVPAFAVGRAQLILHLVAGLQESGRLPDVPLYLNSPMATDVTALYQRHRGQHRLSDEQLAVLQRRTRLVTSVEASKALNRRHGPMIIVSASGMATGGRVLHHLTAFAPDPRNMILLSGFQAGGTRGAALARGDGTVRIYGQDVPVRAEVVQLASASAHADADELLAWLRGIPARPRKVFVTHGEPDPSDALRVRIQRELGWEACIPELFQPVELASGSGG
ncbi:MAG TPA: MBL fold metallo-hydrolase [Luteimonas sp.]|nr:MBL fold metallo-hydrolase [Luteimonas sp.]